MKFVDEFQTAMSTMLATESFTFDLQPGETQSINLWPEGNTRHVIIAFYTHND